MVTRQQGGGGSNRHRQPARQSPPPPADPPEQDLDPPAGVAASVASGDQVLALEALRDHLAVTIEDAPPGAVAAIAKQLREVLADLAAKVPRQEGTALDELQRRRAARNPDPKGRAAP